MLANNEKKNPKKVVKDNIRAWNDENGKKIEDPAESVISIYQQHILLTAYWLFLSTA